MSECALPNIIYVMADDMGFGDLGCYGATKIPTPNIDRLASQGVCMMDAHSASAVCTPSRYSVLTGRYCWRSRLKRWVLWGFEPPLIEPERLTLASMLQQSGYATAAIGKWHVGLQWTTSDGEEPLPDGANVDYVVPVKGGPNDLGFDQSFVITGSLDMAPYCFVENGHVVGLPMEPKNKYEPQQRSGLEARGWKDDTVDVIFADKAVAFIDRHVSLRADQPFFLYLTPSAPHRPCVPPKFAAGASEAGMRGDMVTVVDWIVGQVDDALERNGILGDTLIMVTSDNGARAVNYDGNDYGHRSCGALRGQKADIWDGGHREPLVIRWPSKVAAGSQCDALVGLVDVMATFAEIVGYDLREGEAPDSQSMLGILTGEQSQGRDSLVHHSGGGMFAIRQGDWKLSLGLGSGGFSQPVYEHPEPGGPMGQLYNMRVDTLEQTNQWLARPDVVEQLTQTLVETFGQE